MRLSGTALRGAVVVLLAGAGIGILYKLKSDQTFLDSPLGKSWKWGTCDPALQAAIEANDAVAVTRLLRAVPKSEIRPNFLTFLSRDDRQPCLKAALDAGWNPNGDTNDGKPLIMAITSGQLMATRTLLLHHPALDVYDPEGMPPMCLAARNKGHAVDLVRALYDSGAPNICYRLYDPARQPGSPHATGGSVQKARRFVASALAEAVSADNLDAAQLMLRHGADVNEAMSAAIRSLARLRFVLDHGADPNRPLPGWGVAPIGWLATNGDWQMKPQKAYYPKPGAVEATQLLLDHGAHADAIGNGWLEYPKDYRHPKVSGTAAFFYSAYGQAQCLKLLLAHGAESLKKASNGQTPLDVATGECKAILMQAIRSK